MWTTCFGRAARSIEAARLIAHAKASARAEAFGVCRARHEALPRGNRRLSSQEQIAELGLADARRILQHGFEHRLQLAGRTGDDLQHLRGRGLLLQRLAQIVGALAQLVEQPRVLDGDDGLGGEVLHQLDLLVGERPHLLAIDR